VQRIFNRIKIKNTVFTPDKVLNALMYRSLRFDEIRWKTREYGRNV